MIKTTELDRNKAETYNHNQYLIERDKIEAKIDSIIMRHQLELLDGKEITFSVHDTENQYYSLKDVVVFYTSNGWLVTCNRPWTALFTELIISIPK